MHKTLLKDLYKELTLQLQNHSDTPDLDARLIIEESAGYSYLDILTKGDTKVASSSAEAINVVLSRRQKGEPLSKIYGEKEFWGLRFIVNEHVLDPRPDTESIIEAVLEWCSGWRKENPNKMIRIADVCTGSGCIAIALLKEIKNSTAVATDISNNALDIAKKNAAKNGVEERIEFREGDLMAPLEDDVFDLIVTNPPYIPSDSISNLSESVKNFDPILALDGGNDGLDPYKKIFISLKNNLSPSGRLFLECGFDQIEAINRIGENAGATLKRIIYDLGGHKRGGEFSCGDK